MATEVGVLVCVYELLNDVDLLKERRGCIGFMPVFRTTADAEAAYPHYPLHMMMISNKEVTDGEI